MFLGRGTDRLAGIDGLRYRGGKVIRLKIPGGGVKDRLRRTEQAQKLPRHRRAKARSESERDPVYVSIGVIYVVASLRPRETPYQVSTEAWARCGGGQDGDTFREENATMLLECAA